MLHLQPYAVAWLTFFAKCSAHSQKTHSLHILDARPDDNIYFNYLRNADGKKDKLARECYSTTLNISNAPPIYWINMDRSRRRASAVVDEFETCNIKNHRRIRAFDGLKAEKSSQGTVLIEGKLHISSKLELRNTRQLASLASHLLAISTAVRDQSNHARSNPYALILEDDVSFSFNTDFTGLIASAPSDFGILQLTQSVYYLDVEGWNSYQKDPRSNLWTFRDIEKEYFSLQAYVINKEKLRPIVEKLMTIVDTTTGQSLLQSQSSKDVATMKRRDRTNIRHEPIIADIDEASTAAARVAASTRSERRYEVRLQKIPETESSNRSIVISPELIIYYLGGPTYVLNIPLIRPLDTGKESLVFDGEDIYHRLHKKSDDFKAAVVRDWMSGGRNKATPPPPLPQFLSLPAPPKNVTQVKACLREKSKLKSKKGQTQTAASQIKGKGGENAKTSNNNTTTIHSHSHSDTDNSNKGSSASMKTSSRGSETKDIPTASVMGVVHLGA